MNLSEFTKSPAWIELQEFFKSELVDKPLDIKTKDMTVEQIALEVRASQLAITKINKILNKVRGIQPTDVKVQEWT